MRSLTAGYCGYPAWQLRIVAKWTVADLARRITASVSPHRPNSSSPAQKTLRVTLRGIRAALRLAGTHYVSRGATGRVWGGSSMPWTRRDVNGPPPVLGSGLMGACGGVFGRMRLMGEGLEPVGEVDTVKELLRLEEQHE